MENLEETEAQDVVDKGSPEQDVDNRDIPRAELYIATVRLIDSVTERGSFKGGELLTVGSIRQKYIDWLVDQGFIQENQN